MDYDKELLEKFNYLKNEEEELEGKLHIISIRELGLNKFITRCAIFDEAIVFSISQLLSYKENERFVPIIYTKIKQCSYYPLMYSKNDFIGIASNRNVNDFIMSKSENIDRFLGLGMGYEIYQKSAGEATRYIYNDSTSIIREYNLCDYDENDRNRITFGFLLNNFEIDYSPVSFSHYDFADYPYVQDFIIYLFNLQVNRHGKRLNYEEMQKALNDFLKLKETKSKTNVKER